MIKLRDFIFINSIDQTGKTYEQDLINYFKLDTSEKIDKVTEKLQDKLKVNEGNYNTKYFYLNRKKYKIEQDFLECTYEQFTRLDNLLNENDNINNFNKLLAIYIRPYKWFGLRTEKYSIKTQDKLAEELLDMDYGLAQAILLFFYQNASKSLKYINIAYLNQLKKNTKGHTESR